MLKIGRPLNQMYSASAVQRHSIGKLYAKKNPVFCCLHSDIHAMECL